MDLFSESFLSIPDAIIVKAIKTDGVFCAPAALTENFLRSICEDIAHTGHGLNRNWISPVFTRHQLFLCHMTAVSRSFIKFCTHPRFFGLFDQILGSSYCLKLQRYYETYGGHHMHWHTDNWRESAFVHTPSLIVLAYISDVEDGEFQFVRRSQNWSGEEGYNDYTDQFVEQNCYRDILSFSGPRGTLIIYDTCGIHRARPVKKGKFVRKSIVFQVDSSPGEPLLINPEYIDNLDDRMKRYLGFGQPSGLILWPQTDLSTMPLSMQSEIFWYFIRRLGKKIFRAPAKLLPLQVKSVVKGFFRHSPTL